MKASWFPAPSASISFLLTLALLFGMGITTDCGSGGTAPPPPRFSGNTSVTVLLSSAANDQVSEFDLTLQTLTLTDQGGKIVPVVNASSPAEFVHLNGNIEPLATISIPQGIYVSAAVTLGEAVFVCISQDPNGGTLFSITPSSIRVLS